MYKHIMDTVSSFKMIGFQGFYMDQFVNFHRCMWRKGFENIYRNNETYETMQIKKMLRLNQQPKRPVWRGHSIIMMMTLFKKKKKKQQPKNIILSEQCHVIYAIYDATCVKAFFPVQAFCIINIWLESEMKLKNTVIAASLFS